MIAIAFASLAAVAVLTARAAQNEADLASARAETEASRAEPAELVRAALAGLEIESAALGTENLIQSLQEANQLDTASSLGELMLDRLDAANRAVPDDAVILARRLGLRLQQARIQWQRRNPSLGDRTAAARIRASIAEELADARQRHPESVELLLVDAQLSMEEADASPQNERSAHLDIAIGQFKEAELISGQSFGRQLAMLGTDRADLLFLSGDIESALVEYQQSHEFHARRGDAANRDLAILEMRMADAQQKQGDRLAARILMEKSLARRERLADESARIESGRTRRDLAKAHLYLQELLMEEAPATARRHLKQHLDLTFEVAWLDPMDRRGAVTDLMKAMSIASRLVKLDGGDTSAFAAEIARFRDSIIEPRLQTLPDTDSRRLAIRADRYLTEVAIATRAEMIETGRVPSEDTDILRRLDKTIAIGRAILEIETRDSELTAEVGLCLAYRASLRSRSVESSRADLLEATRLLELSREQGPGGVLQRRLRRQLDAAASA